MYKLVLIIFIIPLILACSGPQNIIGDTKDSYARLHPAIKISSADNYSILKGKMYDATFKRTLIVALVKVRGDTTIEAKTNFDGYYAIRLPNGKFDLDFSYLGYNSLSVEGIELSPSHSVKIDAFLKPTIVLNEKK